MLWDKHLFTRNMTEPLTGSAACVCPYVPEVYIYASTAQTAHRVAQKKTYSRPGCTPLTPCRGARATLTRLCLTQQKTHWREEEQIPIAHVELPCSTCTGFHRHCILLTAQNARKWPDTTRLWGLALSFYPYDPWYQDIKCNNLKESVCLCQMCLLQSVTESRSFWELHEKIHLQFSVPPDSFYLPNWVEVHSSGPRDEGRWKWSSNLQWAVPWGKHPQGVDGLSSHLHDARSPYLRALGHESPILRPLTQLRQPSRSYTSLTLRSALC